jgi:hypothetical protein
MWPAPTPEDWAKPCLVTWQRTWEDAVAVAKETGKPILVCVNMDGEIASEHYAGVRYRQPEIAALYEPYVTVIASVYRHTPRDHDDAGRRIPCPRFGGVTCGEHIAIEPVIYEKFLDGQRVAPRHIMVDLEGNEVYDVYYANDTASVFQAIREGPSKVPAPKPPVVRGDRPIVERVASRAVEDRAAVEAAYRAGDAALRAALLDAPRKAPDADPTELLRLALLGVDPDLSRKAREALLETKSAAAVPLVSEALQMPLDAAEREALLASLKRLGDGSLLARWLAGVHQGLAGGSTVVDAGAWSGASYPAAAAPARDHAAAVEDTAAAVAAHPDDPEAIAAYADATLALAMRTNEVHPTNARLARLLSEHLLVEADATAARARAAGATGWRADAVQALAAYYRDERPRAYELAAEALKALPPGEPSWTAMAVVTVFAESRWMAIKAAVREKRDWPPEWLADLHTAYGILLRHPLGTAEQVLWHHDLLEWLGARRRAERVLTAGIDRFRDSLALHAKWREHLLRRGPEALEDAYERLLAEAQDPARLAAFAGFASFEAAEQHRRARRLDDALAAYARSIGWYEQAVEADARHRDGAAPAIALAEAGTARVAYELGDDDQALAAILRAFAASPETAGTRDGMGFTPGETAQMLLHRLAGAGRGAEAERLRTALDGIEPDLLAPDVGLGGEAK